jgi:hypothetical protein
MSRLSGHSKALYELRFSPMCKPAAEVAGVTKLESHSTRARVLLMWRVASGFAKWGPREVELMYQSTLDSISEAFDPFHYPVSELMLAARGDIWDAGQAPEVVREAIDKGSQWLEPAKPLASEVLVLGGEISQLGQKGDGGCITKALQKQEIRSATWVVPTGALAYSLGAQGIASDQARRVVDGLVKANVRTVVADGPETAWVLQKIYPILGIALPAQVKVKLLSELLSGPTSKPSSKLGRVLYHDSRPACLIAERMPNHLAILPGYHDNEEAFGAGKVYDAPRRLIDAYGGERVFTTWTRGLSRSAGSDDGLWLTYPDLARELAVARLSEAEQAGAELIVTDSPLAANILHQNRNSHRIQVKYLAEIVAND